MAKRLRQKQELFLGSPVLPETLMIESPRVRTSREVRSRTEDSNCRQAKRVQLHTCPSHHTHIKSQCQSTEKHRPLYKGSLDSIFPSPHLGFFFFSVLPHLHIGESLENLIYSIFPKTIFILQSDELGLQKRSPTSDYEWKRTAADKIWYTQAIYHLLRQTTVC